MLTVENIISALPVTANKKTITTGVVNAINAALVDVESMQRFRENLLGYNNVLMEGRYKTTEYINAVMYVSFKLMGYSNIDAYARTFRSRIEEFERKNKTADEIHRFVFAYNRTKLVTTILAQSQIPTHILNADIYQEAINVQAELMRHSTRDDVRQKAAASLMEHLAQPVDSKIKLEIENTNNTNFVDAMAAQVQAMVDLQRQQLLNGTASLKDISKQAVTIEHVSS